MSVTTTTIEAVITVQSPVEGYAQPRFRISFPSNGQYRQPNFEVAERAAFCCPGCTKATNIPRDVLGRIYIERIGRFGFHCKRCDFPITIVVSSGR